MKNTRYFLEQPRLVDSEDLLGMLNYEDLVQLKASNSQADRVDDIFDYLVSSILLGKNVKHKDLSDMGYSFSADADSVDALMGRLGLRAQSKDNNKDVRFLFIVGNFNSQSGRSLSDRQQTPVWARILGLNSLNSLLIKDGPIPSGSALFEGLFVIPVISPLLLASPLGQMKVNKGGSVLEKILKVKGGTIKGGLSFY